MGNRYHDLDEVERVHLVGAGGSGMSALAAFLLREGKQVSGSDLKESAVTRQLERQGAAIYYGHRASQVEGAGLLAVSSAVPGDNPEVLAAKRRGIPVLHRSELLAAISSRYRTIAVTGSHGKTTTTAMTGSILDAAGWDPAVVAGAAIRGWDGNIQYGRGSWLVIEADESDGSFLNYDPQVAVITNIENDHLDHYGTMTELQAAFQQFAQSVPSSGTVVLGTDDPINRHLARELQGHKATFGCQNGALYTASDIRPSDLRTRYQLHQSGQPLAEVELSVPGQHNVLNSLAAAATALELGVPVAAVRAGLAAFQGAERRFEVIGHMPCDVVDDYAHHPTEIKVTLATARQHTTGRLICVFQPHRYSRTRNLYKELAQALVLADQVVLLPIYGANEQPLEGVSSELIAGELEAAGQPVERVPGLEEAVNWLRAHVQPNDLVVTAGAGNVDQVAHQLCQGDGEQ